VVLDKFTIYLDNSLVCFLFTFEGQYRSAALLFKWQALGQSVTSQWTLIRKITTQDWKWIMKKPG
jgi:hypothetical protein